MHHVHAIHGKEDMSLLDECDQPQTITETPPAAPKTNTPKIPKEWRFYSLFLSKFKATTEPVMFSV